MQTQAKKYVVTIYEHLANEPSVPYEQREFTNQQAAERFCKYANTWAPIPDEDGWYMSAELSEL